MALPHGRDRRGASVRHWMGYAIDALAVRGQMPPSALVNLVLTAYCKRQRGKTPPAPRRVSQPN